MFIDASVTPARTSRTVPLRLKGRRLSKSLSRIADRAQTGGAGAPLGIPRRRGCRRSSARRRSPHAGSRQSAIARRRKPSASASLKISSRCVAAFPRARLPKQVAIKPACSVADCDHAIAALLTTFRVGAARFAASLMLVLSLRSAHGRNFLPTRTRVRASRRMRTGAYMRPHASRRFAAQSICGAYMPLRCSSA
jgi:hypothetical protein